MDPAIAGIAVYRHPPQVAAAHIAAPAIASDINLTLLKLLTLPTLLSLLTLQLLRVRHWYFIASPISPNDVSHT